MKKKHFLFTSLSIAAILSANIAHAEEGTPVVSELENKLIVSDESKSEQASTDPQVEDNQDIDSESSHRSVPETEEGLDVPLGSSELPGVEVTVERTFDQTAVREEALKAVRELREEMWDINPWFDGKKLQDVVKETGFQGKEDYAQALEWDNELETYAVQRSVEVSYVWAHKRPDGSGALEAAPEKVHGENLSMGYPTVTEAIKTSWGHGELEALNANQGYSNSANGHLHNQLNPEFKSFAVGVSDRHYAQSLSWSAADQTDGLKFDGKHTIKLKVTDELAKHEDFVKKENPKQEVPKLEESKPQTQTGMDIEAIKNGDYSSIAGVWRRIDETSNVVPYVMVSEHGFSANAEVSYKDLKIGETRTIPERYTWTRQLDETYGYPVDSIGFYRSEGLSWRYVPKGMSYSTLVWDNGAKTVTKVATEDLIVEQGIGYHVAVYTRVTDIDNFYTISAGDYGMGTLVDSFGRSVVDSNYVVVTGQMGDTIDLNAVGGRFGREGKAIYRVTLSNGKDELTLPDYKSSFVLDETTKAYNKISIVYDTDMPKPKANDNNSKPDESDKTPDTKEPTIKPNGEVGRTYTAEQELIARVWKTVTGGEYPYFVVKKDAKTPIVGLAESKVYPKVTYFIAEDTTLTKRSYAMSYEVTFSDNGDGTVTIYKVPKHWHIEDKDVERVTKEILDTAQIIRLEELTEEETGTVIKLATSYTGFTAESPKTTRQSSDGEKKVVSPKVEGAKETASTSETKTALPKTGDKSRLATVIAGFGLLLTSLGLAYHRKRS